MEARRSQSTPNMRSYVPCEFATASTVATIGVQDDSPISALQASGNTRRGHTTTILEAKMQYVFGKTLTRKRTKSVTLLTDELDAEVHRTFSDVDFASPISLENANIDPMTITKHTNSDSSIPINMYDIISFLENNSDDDNDDHDATTSDHEKIRENKEMDEESVPIILTKEPSYIIINDRKLSANGMKALLTTSNGSRSNVFADKINLCREHSTVRIGNTVLFPLVLLSQPIDKRRFDLSCSDFHTWKHYTDGSNSHIYKARCSPQAAATMTTETFFKTHSKEESLILKTGLKVIIKALKDSELENPVALQEFDSERELLSSISHPNILQFLGSGVDLCNKLTKFGMDNSGHATSHHRNHRSLLAHGNSMNRMLEHRPKVFPRPFLVLERLNGGSLTLLLQTQKTTFLQSLKICKELAQAIHYLHHEFHPDAILIHRDLKPDNIGFDDKGILKLMDFGISTCIRRSVLAQVPYLMTGCTGSLRYMAKEVFLEQPYNQNVDVYSFGIIMWQVMTSATPFPQFSKEKFKKEVVERDLRPSIEAVLAANTTMKSPSPQVDKVVALMQNCWSPHSQERPDIADVLELLTMMYEEENMINIASGFCC